jgi:hypothetical protein
LAFGVKLFALVRENQFVACMHLPVAANRKYWCKEELPHFILKEIYNDFTLLLFLLFNVTGFIVDVVLVDSYDMI